MPGVEGKLDMMCGLWERMQPVLAELAEQYMPIFRNMLGKVGDLFEMIAPAVSQFVDSLLPVLAQLLAALAPIISTVVDALGPAFDMIGSLVSSLLPALASLIGFLADVFQAAAPYISETIAGVLDTIMSIVGNIIGVFTGLCDFISNVFAGNWEAAWNGVVSAFANIIMGIAKVAIMFISPVVDIINSVITGINGIVIPDWVPGVGGKSLNIPTIQLPQLASGGFTDGVSIAGEAGTEAVISFDQAYRNENLSYWARAGHMLGVDDSLLDAFESRNSDQGGMTINVTFAPQITINGTETPEFDLMKKLREEEENLVDMLADMLDRRGGDQYKASFG